MLVLRLGAEAERIVQIIEARLRLTEVFARIAPADPLLRASSRVVEVAVAVRGR
jgi:hypothetical protein